MASNASMPSWRSRGLLLLVLIIGAPACSSERHGQADTSAAGNPSREAPAEDAASVEAAPDFALVAGAYTDGTRWHVSAVDDVDAYVLPQVASVSGLATDDLNAFVASGSADAALAATYRRLGLVRGMSSSENALLFVVAWEVYHGRQATAAEVQGVMTQIAAGPQQSNGDHRAQKRFYELAAAAVQRKNSIGAEGNGPAFRVQLRQTLLAGSGNDLAEFELTPEGFVRR